MWNRTRPRSPVMPPALPANGFSSIMKNLFKSEAREVGVDDMSTSDAIIAVMGPTGSGKSSFIELATGITGRVGHGLESFTNEVSVIKLSFPGLVDSDICFVDTPGFDDTNKSDHHILKMISDWLNKTYKKKMRLSGLLYFHRISDNRMGGTPLKNLRMFEKLCGEEFDRIVLATTMWDEVDLALGEEREEELKSLYWKSMIDRGSSVKRFLYTRESAFEVLAPIFDKVNSRNALLLQKEMSDLGLQLKETSAGRALYMTLEELVERQQNILGKIRSELMEPTLSLDQLQVLMEEYQRASVQLQRANDDMRKMQIRVGDRIQRIIRTINWRSVFTALSRSRITRFTRTDRTTEVTTANLVTVSRKADEETTPIMNHEDDQIDRHDLTEQDGDRKRQEEVIGPANPESTPVLEHWVRIYLPWVEPTCR